LQQGSARRVPEAAYRFASNQGQRSAPSAQHQGQPHSTPHTAARSGSMALRQGQQKSLSLAIIVAIAMAWRLFADPELDSLNASGGPAEPDARAAWNSPPRRAPRQAARRTTRAEATR